jgi:hypothetical protein
MSSLFNAKDAEYDAVVRIAASVYDIGARSMLALGLLGNSLDSPVGHGQLRLLYQLHDIQGTCDRHPEHGV